MKTIARKEVYNTLTGKIFRYPDDPGVTGMHMTTSSAMKAGFDLLEWKKNYPIIIFNNCAGCEGLTIFRNLEKKQDNPCSNPEEKH